MFLFAVKQEGQVNCTENNGGCEQQCTDVKGGFYCSCNTGFKIKENEKKSCDGNNLYHIPAHFPAQIHADGHEQFKHDRLKYRI